MHPDDVQEYYKKHRVERSDYMWASVPGSQGMSDWVLKPPGYDEMRRKDPTRACRAAGVPRRNLGDPEYLRKPEEMRS